MVLRSAYQNMFIKHTYNTKLYSTPIQHANLKIKQKLKLVFTEVIEGREYIRIGLGFTLRSFKKTSKARGRGNRKKIKLQTGGNLCTIQLH